MSDGNTRSADATPAPPSAQAAAKYPKSIAPKRLRDQRCNFPIQLIKKHKKAGGFPPAENQCPIDQALGLGKQFGDRLCLDQLAWLVEVIVYDCLGINTKCVIDRRQQFSRVNGILYRG